MASWFMLAQGHACPRAEEKIPPQQVLRVGTMNVLRLSGGWEGLAQVLRAHGPFDVLALQELPTADGSVNVPATSVIALAAAIGMRVAAVRDADFGLANALLVPVRADSAREGEGSGGSSSGGGTGVVADGSDIGGSGGCRRHRVVSTHECDLTATKFGGGARENRSAVAVVLDLEFGAGVGDRAVFICTHLDAFAERDRLAQLMDLRGHLTGDGSKGDGDEDSGGNGWGISLSRDACFLMGDMNALCRDDYAPDYWSDLVECRREAGIATETAVTTVLAAEAREGDRNWGMVDLRSVAGVVLEGPVATSHHGAHIDYVFGSVGARRRWRPVRVAHVEVPDDLTDHALVICDLTPAGLLHVDATSSRRP